MDASLLRLHAVASYSAWCDATVLAEQLLTAWGAILSLCLTPVIKRGLEAAPVQDNELD